jgi:predicted transcriptional regulator
LDVGPAKIERLSKELTNMAMSDMTLDEYRAKWNLPSDYPMVAPNYSKARSALAKSAGLGRKPAEKPKARGRKKAA